MSDSIQANELSQEDFPAKTSAWLEKGLDLLANAAGYSGRSQELWTKRKANTSSSKTSLVYYQVTKDEILESSSGLWPTSGILLAGELLMLSTWEYPSAGAVSSSLADVLEDSAPQKYYLSQKACEGILRRASKRGKKLPEALEKALVKQVSQSTAQA
jgi:hypothetical protein